MSHTYNFKQSAINPIQSAVSATKLIRHPSTTITRFHTQAYRRSRAVHSAKPGSPSIAVQLIAPSNVKPETRQGSGETAVLRALGQQLPVAAVRTARDTTAAHGNTSATLSQHVVGASVGGVALIGACVGVGTRLVGAVERLKISRTLNHSDGLPDFGGGRGVAVVLLRFAASLVDDLSIARHGYLFFGDDR